MNEFDVYSLSLQLINKQSEEKRETDSSCSMLASSKMLSG